MRVLHSRLFGRAGNLESDSSSNFQMQFPPELYRICEPPRRCSYLPAETASLEYRSYRGLTPEQLEFLLERGWRRFGIDTFRPACSSCSQCVPIRIPVNEFQPNKSQRRAHQKNSHVAVTLGPAEVSQERVDLYNAWHRSMTDQKDWPEQEQTVENYARSFLLGNFPSTHEMQYRIDDRLIGLAVIDVLPNSLSSVYFYHAPDWRQLSPGTFSLLCEIELARQLGLEFVYLGYWIGACPSMAYKNRFHPHQLLHSRPTDETFPAWLKPDRETYNVPDQGLLPNPDQCKQMINQDHSGEQDGPVEHN